MDNMWSDSTVFESVFGDKKKFDNYTEFEELFKRFQQESGSRFRVKSSVSVHAENRRRNEPIDERFRYASVIFCCVHYGDARYRGRGFRVPHNYIYLARGCPAVISLGYKASDRKLAFTTKVLCHNHPVQLGSNYKGAKSAEWRWSWQRFGPLLQKTPLEEGAESTSGVEGGPSSAASFLQSLDLYQQGSSNEHMGGQSEEWAVPQPLPMQQSQQPQPVVAKPKSTPPPALQPAPPPPPPPPPEVCLRWNSYQSNIQSVFPNLLSKEQFVDVTLACEGKSIKCHKVMLSACSTYFEELLSENPCQHPIVLMKDLKFWEVEALVNFMYHGEVNVGQDKLPSLLVAAEALQIKGLASPSSSSQEDSNQEASSVETSRQSIGEEELRAKRGRKRRAVPEAPSVMQASPPPVRPAVPQRPRPVTNTSSAYQSPKTAPSEPKQKRSSLPVVTNVQSIKVEPIEIVDDDEDSRPAEPVAIFTEPYKETGESSKQPDSGGTDKGGSTDGTDTGNDEGQGTGYGMELTSDTVTPDQKSDFGQFQSDSSVSQGYSDDAESADVDCKTSINTV